MKKIIELTFEDGEKWQIPLELIAKNRADYYHIKAFKEKDESFDYDGEVDYVMKDNFEGEDWLKNNMDLNDFEKEVVKIPIQPQNKDWSNADSCIKEVED